MAIASAAIVLVQAAHVGFHQGLHTAQSAAQTATGPALAHNDAPCSICSVLRTYQPNLERWPNIFARQTPSALDFFRFAQWTPTDVLFHVQARAPPLA